ncbi:MAG: S8 family serine peptidase, partial [Halanaerobiaceae bacterium]
MGKKYIISFMLLFFLTFVFLGCDSIKDIVDGDITGHVVLTNTQVDWDQSDESEVNLKSNAEISEEKEMEYRPGKAIVKFADKPDDSVLQKYNLEIAKKLSLKNTYVVDVPEDEKLKELVEELEEESDVVYSEPNIKYTINSEEPDDSVEQYPKQWHYPAISLPSAWESERADNGEVSIAVLDTGLDG